MTVIILKGGEYELWRAIVDRFSAYFRKRKIPDSWKESTTALLYKKGDRKELKNDCPVCFLSTVCKLFAEVITNKIIIILDQQQSRKQTAFKDNYCTTDYIYTLTQLLERAREYKFLPVLGSLTMKKLLTASRLTRDASNQ